MSQQPIYVNTVYDLVTMSGFPPPEHPLFAVIRVEELRGLPRTFFAPMLFNFYVVGLKKNLRSPMRYGRTQYDFKNGALGFSGPNQIIELSEEFRTTATGWMLFFQREFLSKHSLQRHIDQYGFFEYQVNEGLHLSAREEVVVEQLFENISIEYYTNIDRFSKGVVLSNIELLLNYADRFYNRQFITRNQASGELLEQFNALLSQYFQQEQYKVSGLPSVTYFSEALHRSPNYLSDYLRSTTGKTTQEHLHLMLIEKAKSLLLSRSDTISEIAYELGFEYPPYFSRLFKAKTGYSPKGFRQTFR